MTCDAFEAVLKEPDTSASNARLHALITAGKYSGGRFPHVAEDYLTVFIDSTVSRIRRRWAGLALSDMLGVSTEVTNHLTAEKRKLHKVGDIILSSSEREDIKIVAGLVMRHGLEQGIEFASFWSSDKVVNSIPTFPSGPGSRWMAGFQSFLDQLGDLKLADPVIEPCIVYPVAVVASDKFRWASANDGVPVAIVQNDTLTVLLSDDFRRDIQFLDIPLAHVSGLSVQRAAPLHDSQSRKTEHEPWDLNVALVSRGWTYLLNGAERTASELTIIFKEQQDAKECEVSTKELRDSSARSSQRSAPHPRMSSSALIDISSTPPPTPMPSRRKADPQSPAQRPQSEVAARPITKAHVPGTVRLSGGTGSSRSQQQTTVHSQTKQSSPDPLSHSPSAGAHASLPTSVQNFTKHGKAQAGTDARSESSRSDHVVQTEPTQPQHDEAHKDASASVRPTRSTRTKAASQPVQSDIASKAGVNTQSPSASAPPERVTAKRTTYSKGKLQKVSAATKMRASQQLRKQTDIFELPTGGPDEETTETASGSTDRSKGGFVAPPKAQKTKDSSKAGSGDRQGKTTRNKRKTVEDDEFVPTTSRVATRAGIKRKSAPGSSNANKQPQKKARTGHEVVDQYDSDSAEPLANDVKVCISKKLDSDRRANGGARQSNAGPPKQPSSSVNTSRTPLIDRLTGIHNEDQTHKAAFKKPAVPSRATNLSSTPTRRTQAVSRVEGPHTPAAHANASRALPPHMLSSPPGYSIVEEETAVAIHDLGEKEALSSNSKPLPASPNAESTAISGHADRDDVSIEKEKGDLQTARSDPFKQRTVATKITSFTRRLTGESLPGDADLVGDAPTNTALDIDESPDSDTERLLGKAASPSRSQPKRRTLVEESKSKPEVNLPQPRPVVTRVRVHTVEVPPFPQPEHQHDERASQTVEPKTIATLPSSHYTLVKPAAVATGHQKVALEHRQTNDVAAAPTSTKADERRAEDMILPDAPHDIDDAHVEPADEAQENRGIDEDITLVNNDSEEQLPVHSKAHTTKFNSSPPPPPPPPGSPSSHSSTSAESEPASPPPMATSDDEEMEWEASLQPHQRALHDLLIRVSKRVTRHVVDNETAVTDIAEVFASDGEHLLNRFLEQHSGAFEELYDDMEAKKNVLKQEMDASMKALAKERRRLAALA